MPVAPQVVFSTQLNLGNRSNQTPKSDNLLWRDIGTGFGM